MNGPLSLSGVPVKGESLVRLVYLDESGISVHEPILVVAGVFIHADTQWVPVGRHVSSLVEKYVPAHQREGFIFHASQMYHGSGPVFDRNKYPVEKSREALHELLAIPAKFGLPVSFGFLDKRDQHDPLTTKAERRESASLNHGLVFTLCASAFPTRSPF